MRQYIVSICMKLYVKFVVNKLQNLTKKFPKIPIVISKLIIINTYIEVLRNNLLLLFTTYII